MGFGIAKLLISHDYTVTTCTAGRSQTTISRISSASIKGYDMDADFVGNSDIILSIVPPRDAVATAKRVAKAAQDDGALDARSARKASAERLLYIDMNAISPVTSRRIAQVLTQTGAGSKDRSNSEEQEDIQRPRRLSLRQRLSSFANSQSLSPTSTISDVPLPRPPIPISYLDGGIIGGPPYLPPKATTTTGGSSTNSSWILPSLIVSGPPTTTDTLLPRSLQTILNATIVSPTIGHASTLKCSFASLTKGLTAIAILSFTTAQSQSPSILPHLLNHLERYAPAQHKFLQSSLPKMPHKAYRWIDEMREIGQTFSAPVDEQGGGFSNEAGKRLFDAVAEVYRVVSEDTELGDRKQSDQGSRSGTGSSGGLKRTRSSIEEVADGSERILKQKPTERDSSLI
ncbi:hypothetical protein DV736_g359, partial [Chaetothyriales sp. CBS 134916]